MDFVIGDWLWTSYCGGIRNSKFLFYSLNRQDENTSIKNQVCNLVHFNDVAIWIIEKNLTPTDNAVAPQSNRMPFSSRCALNASIISSISCVPVQWIDGIAFKVMNILLRQMGLHKTVGHKGDIFIISLLLSRVGNPSISRFRPSTLRQNDPCPIRYWLKDWYDIFNFISPNASCCAKGGCPGQQRHSIWTATHVPVPRLFNSCVKRLSKWLGRAQSIFSIISGDIECPPMIR